MSAIACNVHRYFAKWLHFGFTGFHLFKGSAEYIELMQIEIHKNQHGTNFVRGILVNEKMRKGCSKKISTASEIDHFIHNFAVT